MSGLLYARRVKCDFCGSEADIPLSGLSYEQLGRLHRVMPPGWGDAEQVLRDITGQRFSDVCDTCMKRPLADVLARLSEVPGQVQA